jgi:hypothetical protein
MEKCFLIGKALGQGLASEAEGERVVAKDQVVDQPGQMVEDVKIFCEQFVSLQCLEEMLSQIVTGPTGPSEIDIWVYF